MGAVDKEFFGNAAHIDTGAAQIALLGHPHFSAKLRGNSAGPHTPGARTNHKKIKICHNPSCPSVTAMVAETAKQKRKQVLRVSSRKQARQRGLTLKNR